MFISMKAVVKEGTIPLYHRPSPRIISPRMEWAICSSRLSVELIFCLRVFQSSPLTQLIVLLLLVPIAVRLVHYWASMSLV